MVRYLGAGEQAPRVTWPSLAGLRMPCLAMSPLSPAQTRLFWVLYLLEYLAYTGSSLGDSVVLCGP